MLRRRTPIKSRRKGAPALRLFPRPKLKVIRVRPKRLVDVAYRERVRALGCRCCQKDGRSEVVAQIHHPKHGQGAGQRAGDDESLPICEPHHQGGWERENTGDNYVFIAIHKDPIGWKARYGTEASMVEEVRKELKVWVEP